MQLQLHRSCLEALKSLKDLYQDNRGWKSTSVRVGLIRSITPHVGWNHCPIPHYMYDGSLVQYHHAVSIFSYNNLYIYYMYRALTSCRLILWVPLVLHTAFTPSNGCSCGSNTCWINHKACLLLPCVACTSGISNQCVVCVSQCVSCPNVVQFAMKMRFNDFKTKTISVFY